MSDWAEEIALKLHGFSKQFDTEWPAGWVEVVKPTAAALRKVARENKAAGMREAAALFEDTHLYVDKPLGGLFSPFASALYAAANKIEHGEPTE